MTTIRDPQHTPTTGPEAIHAAIVDAARDVADLHHASGRVACERNDWFAYANTACLLRGLADDAGLAKGALHDRYVSTYEIAARHVVEGLIDLN